ncbi:MAG: superoxide dismutase family protein, partial [Chloroflexota bacterium]|nr:superoxide dismutase family protein [Chloroflexota bacterium]
MQRSGWFIAGCVSCMLAACAVAPPTANTGSVTTLAATVTPASGLMDTAGMTDTMDMTDTMMMTDTAITTSTTDGLYSSASAVMVDREGNAVGTALFTSNADGGVNIDVELTGFSEAADGERGIHVHQIGSCEPDFQAAGGHLNPDQLKHGSDNPAGPHGGDLPNITVDADGNATYTTDTSLISISVSRTAMLDADGAALVIHTNPDDYTTDPDGKSGTRIACGVVVAGETPTVPTAMMPPPLDPITGSHVSPAHRAVTDELIAGLALPEGFQ